MPSPVGTAEQLISAATQLFAERGYDGTSIRAITDRARSNLGAITYHFGSKEALYEAVFEAVVAPSHQRLVEAAARASTPLDQVEECVRALFDYLRSHPEMPRLLMHHLVAGRPLNPVAHRIMRGNIGLLASLIEAGQADGSVRPGDPHLMALSVGSQALYLMTVAHALREGAGIDLTDPGTQQNVVTSVIRFVRAGLATTSEVPT